MLSGNLLVKEEQVIMFDINRFKLHEQISSSDVTEIIAFLNVCGSDLLQSGLITYRRDSDWISRWTNKQMTRVALIRERATGRIVAVASMNLVYTWRKGIGTIGYVLSDPGCRGQGLGRAVVLELIRQSQETVIPALDRIELVSEPHRTAARALYESIGFKLRVGSDRDYYLNLSEYDEHPLVA